MDVLFELCLKYLNPVCLFIFVCLYFLVSLCFFYLFLSMVRFLKWNSRLNGAGINVLGWKTILNIKKILPFFVMYGWTRKKKYNETKSHTKPSSGSLKFCHNKTTSWDFFTDQSFSLHYKEIFFPSSNFLIALDDKLYRFYTSLYLFLLVLFTLFSINDKYT